MSRLPMLTPDVMMNNAQRAVADAIMSGPRSQVHGRGTGSGTGSGLLGPFNAWIRSPEIADHAQQLGAFLRFHTQLPTRLSELAIIVVGRHMRAAFEFTAHAPLAIQGGLGADIVDAIRIGATPEFINADERVVHSFAKELLERHRVSDTTYQAALTLFGEQAVVELVALLGYYSLVSLTLNAFEVPLRAGMTDPFAWQS